jgi:hypothetical protein
MFLDAVGTEVGFGDTGGTGAVVRSLQQGYKRNPWLLDDTMPSLNATVKNA